jgi:hypothetical protein
MCHGFELARSSGQQLCRHSQWWLFVEGDIFVTKLSDWFDGVLVVIG